MNKETYNHVELKAGKYLKYDIYAFSGDMNNMWLIVFDDAYNYMLFNAGLNYNLIRYNRKWLPFNSESRKNIEYYSNFENALDNLCRVIVNGNKWKPTFLKQVFQ